MKPIESKRFYFSMYERLFWSEAYQSLPPSAVNLMMCFYTELRWSKKNKKKRRILNNSEISFSEYEFKKNNLGASQTYLNARDKLIEVGFIKLTYRGGMAKGDMNQYKLLWVDDVIHKDMRWKRYPNENWKHEIPKIKDYIVGRKTQFKKKLSTLQNDTLKCDIRPTKIDPIITKLPTKLGCNS
jgi:hypothetical protein